jgi:DNA-binding CsgD family transcriptional regulator
MSGSLADSLRERSPRGATIVGRKPELDALAAWLRGDAAGVALVGGEPGVGKSCLLREFSARSRADGWLVLAGHAYDGEGWPPYLPFIEALRQYIETSPEGAAETFVAGAPEVATLLPEVIHLAPPATLPRRSPESERYALFQAVSGFLVAAAASTEARGILLCLDDLHWADRSTLLLFQHLARKLPASRLRVLATYRTVGVDPGHPLLPVLGGLTRERLHESIGLGPLSEPETAALVSALAGRETAPALSTAIHVRTRGNPFFIQEVVRKLRADDRDFGDSALARSDWGIPEGIRQVIGSRIAGIDPVTRRFLHAAAVLGDDFGRMFPVIGQMLETAVAPLTGAVEDAVAAGILRESAGNYRFAHAITRDALLEDISLPRRQGLHLAAARAIEDIHARHLDPWLSAIAVHYRQAGPFTDGARAITFALRAGEAAERALAYDEAIAHWDAALDLMDRHGASFEERFALIERLGEVAQISGFDNYARSISYFEQALAMHQRAGGTAGAAAMHARLALVLAAGSEVNDNPAALRHLDAAEPFLRDGPPTHARLCYYSARGLIAVWREQPRQGLEDSRTGMELATALGEDDRWVSNAVMHSTHLNKLGHVREAIELNARAWDVADRLNNPFRAYTAAGFQATRLLRLRAPREALECALREAGPPRELHAPTRRLGLLGHAVDAHALAGDLDAARELARATGAPRGAYLALYEGRWDRLEAATHQNLQTARRKASLQDEYQALGWLATVCELRGDRAGAIEALTCVVEGGRAAPNSLILMSEGPALAILLALGGHQVEAMACIAPCLEILSAGEDWHGLAGRVALAQAAVAGFAGCLSEAEAHFSRAVATFQRYSLPWDEAETATIRGQVLARAGRSHRHAALESFERAIEIYAAHGAAQPWLDRVLAIQRHALGAKPAGYPDGLTEREVEVLRLIASGLSSKDIGEALVLSVRTVERHIANLYLKTNTHGRAQATTYALAHGFGPQTS